MTLKAVVIVAYFGLTVRVIEAGAISNYSLLRTYRKRIYDIDIIILKSYPLGIYVGSNGLFRSEDTRLRGNISSSI